ncbi:hypothetical protein C6P46_000875 [Rhodotorula mucilaginosa]|uniref:Choline transporter n=1 Tax=Rhodotorula mucilaginosa TaxID=5537 RepID=A0A9P7B2K5_RHOMI|nr:hypothetical protein C6P46_000875 [Rhodotorula mucilaginosa]
MAIVNELSSNPVRLFAGTSKQHTKLTEFGDPTRYLRNSWAQERSIEEERSVLRLDSAWTRSICCCGKLANVLTLASRDEEPDFSNRSLRARFRNPARASALDDNFKLILEVEIFIAGISSGTTQRGGPSAPYRYSACSRSTPAAAPAESALLLSAMAERRHLGSNAPSTTTLDSGAGSPGAPQKALSAEQEKHYSHAKINEVTKSEQNHGQLKNFSLLSLIGLAYCILNSWTAASASLSVVLPSGGPIATLYGLIVSFVGVLATAASLAEIVHVFPTSGGPYHFAAILAPPEWSNGISWVTGWLGCAGWVTLTATTGSLAGSLLLGAYTLAHPEHESQPYQTVIIFIAFILIAVAINMFLPRLLPMINSAALIWSLAGAFTIFIVTLATASPNYQRGAFVFGGWQNETGWPNGVAFILGLLQSDFCMIGIDGLSHASLSTMVEEIPQPHINVPRAMILAVVVGASSSFVLLIALLFVMTDINAVISSPAGCLAEICYQATGSVAGAICLQVFPIISMEFAAQGIMAASSRMLFAFARDDGLPFAKFFSKNNPRTGVPDRTVIFTAVWCIIFSLVYLGSNAAFQAILSSSVVLLELSYCIPIALLLIRGRHLLRPESFPSPTWTLGPVLGPITNVVALIFTSVTVVFFLFPGETHPTGNSMNYAVVVIGFVLLLCGGTWIFQGRKHFIGPRDLGGLLELARVEVNHGEVSRPASVRRGSSSQTGTRVGHQLQSEKGDEIKQVA